MKKIAILVDQLHSHGGIEKLVALKANYWSGVLGHQVTLISTEQEGKPPVYTLVKGVGFTDWAIGYDRGRSYFSPTNIWRCLSNIIKCQRYILREQPDVILVASHIPVTYFLPFLWRKGKIAKEFHFTKFERAREKSLKNRLIQAIESRYDYLVVLSEEEKSFYPSRRAVVIPNPVIPFQGAIPEIDTRGNIAAAALRFAPVKQLEKMIEVWGKFSSGHPDWKLHIFGTTGNDYFKRIAQIISERNLEGSIIFRGESADIQQELSQSKALLMTSAQECFPMVILEAQSAGTPVIAFDCPTGPRNILHHKTDGILVDYNNCGSFAEILGEFADNPGFQGHLSRNAVENARKYNLPLVMEQWNRLILNRHD